MSGGPKSVISENNKTKTIWQNNFSDALGIIDLRKCGVPQQVRFLGLRPHGGLTRMTPSNRILFEADA